MNFIADCTSEERPTEVDDARAENQEEKEIREIKHITGYEGRTDKYH